MYLIFSHSVSIMETLKFHRTGFSEFFVLVSSGLVGKVRRDIWFVIGAVLWLLYLQFFLVCEDRWNNFVVKWKSETMQCISCFISRVASISLYNFV